MSKIQQLTHIADVRAILAFGLVAACVAMTVLERAVPGELWALTGTATGYYFASRENGEARQHAENMSSLP